MSQSHILLKNIPRGKTLLEAAKIRRYGNILKYENGLLIPDIVYHSECRKSFVLKTVIKRLMKRKKGSPRKESLCNTRETRKPPSLGAKQDCSVVGGGRLLRVVLLVFVLCGVKLTG